jgi:hypothetical protein
VVINDFSLSTYERAIEELNGLLSEGDTLRERCIKAAEKHFSLQMGVKKYWDIYRRLIQENESSVLSALPYGRRKQ